MCYVPEKVWIQCVPYHKRMSLYLIGVLAVILSNKMGIKLSLKRNAQLSLKRQEAGGSMEACKDRGLLPPYLAFVKHGRDRDGVGPRSWRGNLQAPSPCTTHSTTRLCEPSHATRQGEVACMAHASE